jgi:hypothetical protein
MVNSLSDALKIGIVDVRVKEEGVQTKPKTILLYVAFLNSFTMFAVAERFFFPSQFAPCTP